LAQTALSATADEGQIGAPACAGKGYGARERHLSAVRSHPGLARALAVLVGGCGGAPPARCQIDDLDDRMVSTRAVLLERLAGCPIGGRH
jgi:hypothetical protein